MMASAWAAMPSSSGKYAKEVLLTNDEFFFFFIVYLFEPGYGRELACHIQNRGELRIKLPGSSPAWDKSVSLTLRAAD